jgi:MATE family multidrug resistance protein
MVAVPMTLALWLLSINLAHFGLHPDIERMTQPYLSVVSWRVCPLLLYAACRRYLQGIGLVRPISFALVSANIVNAFVNYTLIYGAFGAPAMGIVGAAWATVLSRVYMLAVLVFVIWQHGRRSSQTVRSSYDGIHAARLSQLFWLGLPAALQVTLEVGVFAAATALAGRLDPVSLASHQIVLNIAGTTFMVPLGVASAAAVLVGHAVGRRDDHGARRAGWTAIAIVAVVMLPGAFAMIFVPGLLLRPFTSDAAVIQTAAQLLIVAAVFQVFDGLQVVSTGALRGLGDTRTAMRWSLFGHWAVGLPLAYVSCFVLGWGVTGLWLGLASGLMICGVVLVGVWARRVGARQLP